MAVTLERATRTDDQVTMEELVERIEQAIDGQEFCCVMSAFTEVVAKAAVCAKTRHGAEKLADVFRMALRANIGVHWDIKHGMDVSSTPMGNA